MFQINNVLCNYFVFSLSSIIFFLLIVHKILKLNYHETKQKRSKKEDTLQMYIQPFLLDFDKLETIFTLKKAEGLISQPKRSFLKKA